MPSTTWLCCAVLVVAAPMAWGESVHREVLPGGLVLVVQEFHQTPAAEVRVAVRAGPVCEGPLLGSGASVLLQRVLVNAGGDETRRAIARLGNRFHAETSVATAVYGLSVTGDQVGGALELLASMLGNYQYAEADLQRERAAILAQPSPTPAVQGELLLASVLHRQHPARLPLTGTPAMLDQVTLDLLRRYQAARYTAATTVITVVGNVNTNEVRRLAAQAFTSYAVGGFQPAPAYVEPPQVGPRYASAQVDLQRPQVAIAWRTEAAEHPAQPALALLAQVLDDALPAAFTAATVDATARVELRAPIDQPGALVVGFAVAPAGRADGERAVYAAVDALAKGGPSADALASAKRQVRRAAAQRQESAASRAEDLERWELATGDPAYGITYAAAIDAASAEDVARVARKYCGDPAKACTVVLRTAADPAEDAPGKAAEPVSSVAPSVIDLGNGLRLAAHPPTDVPVTHLVLTLGGVLAAEEPQLSGSAAALAALLPMGAGPRTAADLAALGRSTGMEFTAQCGRDAVTVAITCLSEDTERALEVLADLLTRPTLDAGELEKVRADLLRRIDAAAADRGGQLIDTCRATALAGDPLARPLLGAKDVVARLDRGAVEALWRRVALGGNEVLSIAGRYDRAAVVASLDRLLAIRPPLVAGTLAPPAAAPATTVPPLSVIYRDGAGAAVALAWKLPALGEAPDDEAPLAVLAALLTGVEVPGGRINRALATLPGMPTLAANAETYARGGLWIVHGEVDPAALDAVPQVAREQVAQLLAQLELSTGDPRSLSAAELATAKQMCLTAHALRQEDGAAAASRAAVALLDGQDPGRDAGYAARVAAVKGADLQRVAAKWLTAEPVLVVAKPRAREAAAKAPTEGSR